MWERPTIKEINDRVLADAESRLGRKPMRFSVVTVLCRVIAGAFHELYGFIQFVMSQCFASTAEGKWLERQGSEINVYRRPSVAAVGEVKFEGDAVVPAGTMLQTRTGVQYITEADSHEGKATIKALAPGADGNLQEGSELSFLSPVEGVRSTAITGAVTGGVDREGDESLRERILFKKRHPPHGGSKSDYVSWAREVPGVTRAWCYPRELGDGHVTVRFMTDGLTSNGIPDKELVKRVQEHIESKISVIVVLDVVAPIPKTLDVAVEIVPDDESNRERVRAAVQEVVVNESAPNVAIMLSSISRSIANIREIKSYRVKRPTDDVSPGGVGMIFVDSKVTFE